MGSHEHTARHTNLRVSEGRPGAAGLDAGWGGHCKQGQRVTAQWRPGAIDVPHSTLLLSSSSPPDMSFVSVVYPRLLHLSTQPPRSLSGSLAALQAEPLPWLFQCLAGELLSFPFPCSYLPPGFIAWDSRVLISFSSI